MNIIQLFPVPFLPLGETEHKVKLEFEYDGATQSVPARDLATAFRFKRLLKDEHNIDADILSRD